ncbi:hypothetical protein HAX54_031307 [Datura stramonium]|uniref:Uncharacterized protein n=1 Tax=Datura stramonium TaxID=4076 RepID=A0ABS8SBT2_DATST|nr:hypothetical protein [Datura stramonium]
MASQKVFIDLVDNETERQDFGSRQDKVTPFEARMESMERKIDRIRGLVVDLRNSSDVPSSFLESMSKSHSVAPIHTVSPLTLSTSLIQNAQEESSLYSLALQKALDGLEEMAKVKKRGDKPPGYMAGTTQQREKDKLAKLMEDGKKNLDFSIFEGSGDPHSHLKAYLNKLADIGQNEYDNKLKRKIIEPVIKEVMMHNKFDLEKSQSKDKGKVMIKPPKFKTRKSQVLTQLAEPPAITFEMLRSHGILQPKNDGIPNPLRKNFNPNKHCTFHSGMQGHDTNECRHLKKEIQKLIISGRISQTPRPQLVWYQPPEIIPTPSYTLTYRPPFTMRPPIQTM